MGETDRRARAAGVAVLALTLVVAGKEWALWAPPWPVIAAPFVAMLLLFWPELRRTERIFVLVAVLLSATTLATGDGGWEAIGKAVGSAGFIGAFFTALSVLRHAADGSPRFARAGRYLAEQPPGRRYGALTLGGQLFALPLSYGAIQLLGGLAVRNADTEPDPEIRHHRRRRMLLAIQRAFVSTLAWSPLSLAMAVSTAEIPGASWNRAVWPGLVTMVLFAGIGWALDTLLRPRLSRPAPRRPQRENATAMLPLAVLLALLLVGILAPHLAFGIRIVGVVMVVVPLLSIGWILLQARATPGPPGLRRNASAFLFVQLPSYRSELTLLTMAGYLGTIGAPLLEPLIAATPLHPEALSGSVILVALVWIIPLAGQVGMNPILAVTLLSPLLPDPAVLGLTPTSLVVATTAGWTLSAITTPFTATTLLVGHLGQVSARHVGLVWNGLYFAIMLATMSAWVLVHGYLIG